MEKGEWKILEQSEKVDHYIVELNGKHIEIIAEVHGVRESNQRIEKIVGKADPDSWCLLIENGLENKNKFIKRHRDNINTIPDNFLPLNRLVKENKISIADVLLALATEQLSNIGILLNLDDKVKQLVTKKIPDFLDFSVDTARKILLNNGINVSQEDAKKIKNKISNDDTGKLAQHYNSVTNLLYEESNKEQKDIVSNSLREKYNNFLIFTGKAHVGSLIKSGPIAEYTKEQIEKSAIKKENIETALRILSEEVEKSEGLTVAEIIAAVEDDIDPEVLRPMIEACGDDKDTFVGAIHALKLSEDKTDGEGWDYLIEKGLM